MNAFAGWLSSSIVSSSRIFRMSWSSFATALALPVLSSQATSMVAEGLRKTLGDAPHGNWGGSSRRGRCTRRIACWCRPCFPACCRSPGRVVVSGEGTETLLFSLSILQGAACRSRSTILSQCVPCQKTRLQRTHSQKRS